MLFLWLLLPPFALLAWQGDVSSFTFQKHVYTLNAPAEADTAYLSTSCMAAVNATWKFSVHLAFVPSASNVVRMYVMADTSRLTQPLCGYYVQVGGANKTVSLYRQDGAKGQLLLTAPADMLRQAPVTVHVQVQRSASMHWSLQYAMDGGVWVETDSVADARYTQNKAWGMWCKYTKTRNQAFAFSNLFAAGDTCAIPVYKPINNLFINEILYNPFPNGVDFVELYNAAAEPVDLGRCVLSNGKKQVALPAYQLQPNAYVALTPSDSLLLAQYPEACFEQFLSLPAMPNFVNNEGAVYLLSDTQVLDSLWYSDAMHHSYIQDTEGFSLERESPGGLDWFSAASTLLATPGCENSQAHVVPDHAATAPEASFWLSDSWFNPQHQYVSLFHSLEQGCIANAWVYNLQGVAVYQLYNNTLLSATGSTYWDGRDMAGSPCESGIYVVAIEWITMVGETNRIKLPVALSW